MLDTKVATGKKQSVREVAEIGFDAMMSGDSDVVAGGPRSFLLASGDSQGLLTQALGR